MNKRSFEGCFCAKARNIKKCHSRGFLSGISAIFKNESGGDPRLRPSGMTPYEWTSGMTPLFNHGGFTLIELLVVVLIIAILAAVALPQYNKAVRKAQGAEALAAMDTIDKAMHAYYLEHDTYQHISRTQTGDSTINKLLDFPLPELKYFKYVRQGLVGNTPEFVAVELWSSNPERYAAVVRLLSPKEDIYVVGRWKEGEPTQIYCTSNARSKGVTCSDYFNCVSAPITHVGTSWDGGDCDLKYARSN